MVSIIIPTLNEAATISRTLSNTLDLPGDFEIIVVDGGSTDETVELVQSYKNVRLSTAQKGRSHQMNQGAKLAGGAIFLFLHADTLLPKNAISSIHAIFENNPNCVAGSFYLKFDKKHRLLSFYSLCSRINHSFFTYGDHAIFIQKSCFNAIGGYRPIPFMEDVEIQTRIKKVGKFKKLPVAVITSSRRFIKNGVIKQFVADVLLVLLYKFGFSPLYLKKFYKDFLG